MPKPDNIPSKNPTALQRIKQLEDHVNLIAQHQASLGKGMIDLLNKVGQIAIAIGLAEQHEANASLNPFTSPTGREDGPDPLGGEPITPIEDIQGRPFVDRAPLIHPGGHPLRKAN